MGCTEWEETTAFKELLNTTNMLLSWICADFIHLKLWNLAYKSAMLGKCFIDQVFLLEETKEADGRLA